MATLQTTNKLHEPFRFLNTVRANVHSDAIIAGGAVRDAYYDILPRDFDVFIQDPRFRADCDQRDKRAFTELINSVNNPDGQFARRFGLDLRGNDRVEIMLNGYGNGSNNRQNSGATYGGNYSASFNKMTLIVDVLKNFVPYQLIYVEYNPLDYVDQRFDIGLCKAFCDGTKIRYTPEFMSDVRNNTITVTGFFENSKDLEWTINHHVRKLCNKFPSHTVKIAPHNHHLVDFDRYRWLNK